MKKEFSTAWKSSRQPRKQRKYLQNAALHTRHKFLSAHLSKELRNKYGKRNAPLHKGDEVLVMRGSFADKKAKIQQVNVMKTQVTLEGITRQKKDGTKIGVVFHPSSLMIISLNLEDKQRSERFKENKEKKDAPNKS